MNRASISSFKALGELCVLACHRSRSQLVDTEKQDPKLRLQMLLFVQELVRVWTALGWMYLL